MRRKIFFRVVLYSVLAFCVLLELSLMLTGGKGNGEGGAVSTPTLNTKTATSITINAVAKNTTTNQIVEYAINLIDIALTEGWQTDLTFSGLTEGTQYYIFARSQENPDYQTGTSSTALSVKTLVAGGTVSAPTLDSKTTSSITINAVTPSATGQTVEYAINTSNNAPLTGWQTGLTFSGLIADTQYYIFARSRANTTHYTGAASASLSVKTDDNQAEMVDSGIDYNESINKLNNPGRGFNFATAVTLKKDGPDMGVEHHINFLKAQIPGNYSLMKLQVDLSAFSSRSNAHGQNAAHGEDIEITPEALEHLRQYFDFAREYNVGVIVCFAYSAAWSIDLWPETGGDPPDMTLPVEPINFNLILRHIEQLSEFLTGYLDVLCVIQSGMLGLWGEQHSTPYANNQEYKSRVIQKWLDCVPAVSVNTRTIASFVNWYNYTHGTQYRPSEIALVPETMPGTDEYRVGIWNDAYLANITDMGTYGPYGGDYREDAVAWLDKQASHTFFGGETNVGRNYYNEMAYLEYEAALTHTSYIKGNQGGNESPSEIVGLWRTTTYNGENLIYKGKVTEYDFIERHLGYRFVVRESKLSERAIAGGQLKLCGTIENVGFAPILINTNASVLLVSGQNTLEVPVQLDLNSGTYDFTINIPTSFQNGQYTVYIKFNNKIAFANIGMFNSTLNANKIGTINVS